MPRHSAWDNAKDKLNVAKMGNKGMTAGLNRLWRLFGTALSFTVFGIGGLILGLLVFPLFFVFMRNPSRRQERARKLVGHGFQAFVWLMKSLGVLTYDVVGREHMCDVQRTLIIANHPSLLDVVFLVSFFPQAECVVKRAVTRNPFMSAVAAAANYVSNDDPETMLTECADRLRGGASLILFPEGTRRDQNVPLRFKPGAAAIAVRAESRLMPILIDCQPPTLRKNEPWYHIPRARPHWRFEIPPPMELSEFIEPLQNQRLAARALQSALLGFYQSGGRIL